MILVTVCGTLGRNPPKRTGGGKGYKMRKLPSAVLDDEASEVIFNDPGGGKRREEGIGANEQPADNKPSH